MHNHQSNRREHEREMRRDKQSAPPRKRSPGRSLRVKIILWTFLPTLVILTAVVVITLIAYQQVTEDLVLERNQELVRLSAAQFSSALEEYADILDKAARFLTSQPEEGEARNHLLRSMSSQLVVFDGGVLMLNPGGIVQATLPEIPGMTGTNCSGLGFYQDMIGTMEPKMSNVFALEGDDEQVIGIAVPMLTPSGTFEGILVGLFRLGEQTFSSFYGDLVKLRLADQGSAFVLDGNGRVIFHSNNHYIGEDFASQSVFSQVQSSNGGVLRTTGPEGARLLASYAHVPGTPWSLVIEEDWVRLLQSGSGYRNFLFILLALGMLIPGGLMLLGIRQIIQPINALREAAKEVANGRFDRTIVATSGDEVEDLATQFNLMSGQLRESYSNLEQRVEDRTRELSTLLDVVQQVSSSLELEQVLADILRILASVVNVEFCGMYLMDEESGILHPSQVYTDLEGWSDADDQAFFSQTLDPTQDAFVAQLLDDLRPVVSNFAVLESGLEFAQDFFKDLQSLLAVPFTLPDRVLAVAVLATREAEQHFTAGQVDLVWGIANAAAITIENAHLFSESVQQADEIRALLNVQRAITSRLEPQDVLQLIADEARRLSSAERSAVYLLQDDEMHIAVVSGNVDRTVIGRKVPMQSIAGKVIKTGQSMEVKDAYHHPDVTLDLAKDVQARALLIVPLISSTGPLGTITVANGEPGTLDPHAKRVLTTMASSAVVGLENARLFAEVEQRNDHLEALYHADEQLHRHLDLDAVLLALVDVAVEILSADKSSLMVWDPALEKLVVQAAHGFSQTTLQQMQFDPGEGAVGRVFEDGEPLLVADTYQDEGVIREVTDPEGIRSFLHLPIRVAGQTFGVFNVSFITPRALDEREYRLFLALAQRAALAIENARLYEAEQAQLEETERRRRVAAGLREILRVLNSQDDLSEVFKFIVTQARSLLDADACVLYQADLAQNVVRIDASSGLPDAMKAIEWMPMHTMHSPLGSEYRDSFPLQDLIAIDDMTKIDRLPLDDAYPSSVRQWEGASAESFRSFLEVPLNLGDQPYGSLGFHYADPHRISEEQKQLAVLFADQAALAIENASLREQIKHTATAAERSRLARDLHDAVTQTLFSASIIAEVLPKLWEKDREQGLQRLEELRELTRGALAEMRALLLELRPAALEEAGLAELLQQLVEAFRGRARIPVELTLEEACSMPTDVKVAFYRVAQEALNNIGKHAAAEQVWVDLRKGRNGSIMLSVRDDGCGFCPNQVSGEHFGLEIMRERVETIGAQLDVVSSPRRGTEISLLWRE